MNRNLCVKDECITFKEYRQMKYNKGSPKEKKKMIQLQENNDEPGIHDIIDVANDAKKIKSFKKRKNIAKEMLLDYLKLNYTKKKRRFK